MADDPIIIEVVDEVDPDIAVNLESIGAAAIEAKNGLAGLQVSSEELQAILGSMSASVRALNPEFVAVATGAAEADAALRGLTQTQIDLYRAQQDGINFQTTLNESFGITTAAGEASAKSARDSAAAFKELFAAAEAAGEGLRATAIDYQAIINATTGVGASAGVTAADIDAMGVSLDALRAKFSPLFAEEQRHQTVLAELNEAYAVGAINIYEFTTALDAETAASDAAVAGLTAVAGAAEESSVAATKASSGFGGLLKTLGLFFAAGEVVTAINNYTKLTNAIRFAGLAGEQASQEFQYLTMTARDNGVSIANVATLYQRLQLAQSVLSLSTDKTNTIVKEIAQSFRVNSETTAQATNTMRDLNDIVNTTSTTFLRYFSNLERNDMPIIAAAAAGAGQSIQAFEAAVKSGAVTNVEFFDDLAKGKDTMQGFADTANLTVSQAMTALNDSFTQLVGTVDQGTGVFGLISKAIVGVADNLPLVVSGVLLFGAAWAAIKIGETIKGLSDMVSSIRTMVISLGLLDSEFLAVAATIVIVAGLIVGLIYLVAALTGNTDNLNSTLSNLASQAGSKAKEIFGQLGDSVKEFVGQTGAAIPGLAALSSNMDENSASTSKADDATKKLTASLSSLTGANDNTSTSFTNLSPNVVHVSQMMLDLYNETQDAAGAQGDLVTASTSVITTADGVTHSLLTYTEALHGVSEAAKDAAGSLADYNQQQANSSPTGTYTSSASPDITNLANNYGVANNPDLIGFATGGSFMVNGAGGTDNNVIKFKATAGERVDILTPSQQASQSGGNTFHIPITIVANDPNSFRASKGQVANTVRNIIKAAAVS